MLIPHPEDAVHKAWLYRLLTAIADDETLPRLLYFKGGTCAAMRGFLNRFSVDLDFDFVGSDSELAAARTAYEKIFAGLGLSIKDQSHTGPQYFLRYPAKTSARNTIKIDTQFPPPASNAYEASYLSDIDRTLRCQTKETMVANKLVAVIARHEKGGSIAGRDIYDVHHFFMHGFRYRPEVIAEQRQTSLEVFFTTLIDFIDTKVTQRVIEEDINTLVPLDEFARVRKSLKQETLMLLRDELKRIQQATTSGLKS